jgi:hypothetical protein
MRTDFRAIPTESAKRFRFRSPYERRNSLCRSLGQRALFGQKKYADAEELLVQGYLGMKKFQEDPKRKDSSPSFEQRRTEALERLVQFYDARNRPDEAARWRRELVKGKDQR